MRTKIIASLAAAAASAFLVVGCSDNTTDSSMDGHSMGSMSSASPASSASASSSAQFNDADVMFAQMMYPHHAQAVQMADMANGRTDNPDVLSLASAIAAAQQPEMDQMTAWLTEWGQPAPSADMGQMGGMDHSSGSGMMTTQDMDALRAASGPEFDRQWLTMMIAHHTGAIEMANTEIADGTDPDAQEMARTIVATQQQEIDTMQRLLG
ncbi:MULTISPECIES: DUF305 domain-containing protein [Rhodococcus]|jgi:uncharacterized protein (DUF305 family)|uniref:Uncharacterized protein n=1 Tax=Rhodococcus erythropolis TaxID=1833 RepID=A0A6G9D2K4_RHOER|nr:MULTISPECIES: DUF305 domain-containing protein [Rhodococcus]EEN86816.1 hypothetical protein RHOER0001_0290 [Rhodococcus erythropolis SK121]KDQ03560.1 hypothetical protein EN35_01665 [Rhodococcus qingshengii]KZF15367.1 DUF305 domain-containing protein [Rhodococcus sp. EPR-134]MBW0286029.1 DUF305 domain-containing protein [Rhodococcus sp. FH8]NDK73022.1 DUF305 domain-containing protein [Rhodococcus qingshengii]